MKDAIVVGGGLGGLLVGAELKRRGNNVLVLEGSDLPGGVARTIREDGYLLEPAAGSILFPNPALGPIFAAAGVLLVAANPEARTRFVYDRGRLFEVAESPRLLFTRLVSWRAKLRAAREPWIGSRPPSGEESLLEFFTRRFGKDVGSLGADLMAHGVFAGDPSSLSIQAAYPKLVALETAAGSVVKGALQHRKSRPKGAPRASVHVAPDGMAGVAAQLTGYLGGGFRVACPVRSVHAAREGWKVEWDGGADVADAVVVALVPSRAGAILPDPLGELLASRPLAPIAVVGLGGPSDSIRLPAGFGALKGPNADIRALGILFESEYGPGRAPAGHQLAKGIYGGSADPEIMHRTDNELVALMGEELGRMIGHRVYPTWTRVIRSSIPQYPIGHAAWLRRVDEALTRMPGLHLAGWGYRGIGVSSLGSDAVRIGTALAAESTT